MFRQISMHVFVYDGEFAVNNRVMKGVILCREKAKTFTNEKTADGKEDIFEIESMAKQNMDMYLLTHIRK